MRRDHIRVFRGIVGRGQRARLHHDNPNVRGMAVWALARLCWENELALLALDAASQEADEDVLTEWRAALQDNFPSATPAPTV